MNFHPQHVAVVGSGPAGLMAACILADSDCQVTVIEKRSGPGRKFLIAGSSGLNITYDAPAETFHEFYRGPQERFRNFLTDFPPADWLKFINELGIETFRGTSRRYFVRGMKASGPLRAWIARLREKGVQFEYRKELLDFEVAVEAKAEGALAKSANRGTGVHLKFQDGSIARYDSVLLALGAGSYTGGENPLRWPEILRRKGIEFHDFRATNVGYEVGWPTDFVKEAEGLPLKNVRLTTKLGSRLGDLVITRYGLEGTPVYTLGTPGVARLDLKPDLDCEAIFTRLSGRRRKAKENLSPMRLIKRELGLSPAALALLFHFSAPDQRSDLSALIKLLKSLSISLERPRPLEEAISSAGGVDWSEVDDSLMLKRYPGVYLAGEMLDWDAPTGGFLIQGCVSQGHWVGKRIAQR